MKEKILINEPKENHVTGENNSSNNIIENDNTDNPKSISEKGEKENGTRTEPDETLGEKIDLKDKNTQSEIDSLLSEYKKEYDFTADFSNESQVNTTDPVHDNPDPFASLKDSPIFEEPKKKRGRKSKAEKMTLSGGVISGALFIALIDLMFPLLIGLIHDLVTKGDKIGGKTHRLKLTATQKTEIEPICNEVVKQLELTANPILLLVVSLMGIYGVNFMLLKEEIKLTRQNE